jgi:hypothetical protein
MVKIAFDYDQYEELLEMVETKQLEAEGKGDEDEIELWEGIKRKFDNATE